MVSVWILDHIAGETLPGSKSVLKSKNVLTSGDWYWWLLKYWQWILNSNTLVTICDGGLGFFQRQWKLTVNWGRGAVDQRCFTWGAGGSRGVRDRLWSAMGALHGGGYLDSMMCARGVFLPAPQLDPGCCSGCSNLSGSCSRLPLSLLPLMHVSMLWGMACQGGSTDQPLLNISIVVALAPFAPLILQPLGFFCISLSLGIKRLLSFMFVLVTSSCSCTSPKLGYGYFALKILPGIIFFFLLKMLPSSKLKLFLLIWETGPRFKVRSRFKLHPHL